MIEGRFTERQRHLLRELNALAERRVRAVEETETWYRESGAEAERRHEEAAGAAKTRFDADMERGTADYARITKATKTESRAKHEAAKRAQADERESIRERAGHNEQEARTKLEEAIWATETVFEAQEHTPDVKLRQTEKLLTARRQELLGWLEKANKRVRAYRQRIPDAPEATDQGADDLHDSHDSHDAHHADDGTAAGRTAEAGAGGLEAPLDELHGRCEEVEQRLAALRGLRIAGLFRGYRLHLLVALALIVAGGLTLWRHEWQPNRLLAVVLGATLLGAALLILGLFFVARRQTTSAYRPLADAARAGLAAADECERRAEDERDREAAALVAQRDREIETARSTYEPILEEIAERREHHLKRIEERYPRLLEEIVERGEADLIAAKAAHAEAVAALSRRYSEENEQASRAYTDTMAAREMRYAEEWGALEKAWKDGMARCGEIVTAITTESDALFPDWDDPSWERFASPTTFAPSVRFGTLAVDREKIPGGVTDDERLAVAVRERFTLPATLDFPDHCSLLLLAGEEGRGAAVATIQTVMFRLLTALPPAKVRFTIIDPVGLGENFAGFMHLADYEEAFVTSRIWTETRHIEQRLADLTEHMETVIQKYLRNEFETIADYNEQAGEIAEPYRFLVISDFPANFSDTAARRLASIVSSGARCGVHTLISVDARQQLPKGVELSDMQAHATTLEYVEGAFRWRDEDFRDVPLTLDAPPSETLLTRSLHIVGEASRDATRVEVPFGVIAPPPEKVWSGDCTRTLSVPLGRSGATKLQHLEIGSGTSQHVLIAGKTGSGKSTLLHVLITNLALWFSPDEVQFYLVDFKKGVEFKTYAHHELLHARAVAVESDREFGLSVLQRIDVELKQRGDRFRDLGVQDLAGYRRLGRPEPLPRILLIIDEFQEMFVEDDKLGQDAALLLDRLVRQGRAFGIHVLLGSQTLGGAYTLARSTIGQMQVRIALQCSEADSYLIMSDDNAAARLLARPGEAIYNDAGGAIQGNSPFQIVWLSDEERERQLRRAAEIGRERGYARAEPQIVFEGNVSADVAGNHLLADLLDAEAWPAAPAPSQAWLGEAIAIKGPTAGVLRRQSGNNVLLVGQRDESALAMVATSLVSLAAQHPPGGRGGARFLILDGTPVDSPTSGWLEAVAGHLPHQSSIVKWRDVEPSMADLAAELDRRQAVDETDAPPIFVLVYGLQRFRMLRTSDDFGFSMGGDDTPVGADKHFAAVLRDGPPLGIHTIAWCDTATNLNRTLDRNGLREFEMRVLFQMSGADSTQLIDSPLAARLGLRRALFYNEEEGVLEKFRPYALPDDAWLETVRTRLGGRTQVESSTRGS